MATMSMRFKSGDDEVSFSEPIGDGRQVEIRTVYQHTVVTKTILLQKEDVNNLVAFLTSKPPEQLVKEKKSNKP
jgi:hypothetical protein